MCACVCACACVCVRTYVCVYVCMHACMCVYECSLCMYACSLWSSCESNIPLCLSTKTRYVQGTQRQNTTDYSFLHYTELSSQIQAPTNFICEEKSPAAHWMLGEPHSRSEHGRDKTNHVSSTNGIRARIMKHVSFTG
jgi:hypothetical protein